MTTVAGVPPFHSTETQLLQKRLREDRATGSSASIQETDAEHFPCLLRVCHDGNSKHHHYKQD